MFRKVRKAIVNPIADRFIDIFDFITYNKMNSNGITKNFWQFCTFCFILVITFPYWIQLVSISVLIYFSITLSSINLFIYGAIAWLICSVVIDLILRFFRPVEEF